MSKLKIAIIATSVVGVFGACYAVSFIGSEAALMERFPDIDPKVVMKAHRKMFLAALKGAYSDIDLNNEEVCDAIFLKIVNNLEA